MARQHRLQDRNSAMVLKVDIRWFPGILDSDPVSVDKCWV
jgi:hypothetical protein